MADMSIYVTGDTHRDADIHKLNSEFFRTQHTLSRDDFVIILGDFGCVWDGGKTDQWWLDWHENKAYTTLFVPGNHENYELLRQYPEEQWHGGIVRRIRPHVLMLERGEVFTIDGCKFFCMGGAQSHDMWCRIPSRSWWAEEMPSDAEYEKAVTNLKKHDWEVDYILSHCAPDSIQNKLDQHGSYEHDKLTNFLEHIVKEKVEYWSWFFGHYHVDRIVEPGHVAVFDNIIQIS